MTASLSLQRLEKAYGRHQVAIQDLSLELAAGEFRVLVGPSGSGKSTLLRLIAGLEVPTAGSVQLNERPVDHCAPAERNVAMVFQDFALYPHLTVRQNLAFGLRMRGTPRTDQQQRVQEVARQLQIESLLDRLPESLSGGEQQRVAVGRALVRRPQLFLFDEPLSNLDPQLRFATRIALKRLQRQLGTTTLYVTHDQEEAMALGDQVTVIHAGQVQQTATPLTLYQRPANRFVAGFIGSPPMNFFSGHLRRDGGEWHFQHEQIAWPCPDTLPAAVLQRRDEPLVLGMRPDQFRMHEPGQPCPPGTLTLSGQVAGAEMLGSYGHLWIELSGGLPLAVRGELPLPPTGQPVQVSIAGEHLHWFAADAQGRNLVEAAA